MDNLGLVLEGGGMRCVFTAGVLDFFMEKGLYFPAVYGVSGGACQGFSYLSKQIGRSKDVNIEFINDKRYLSFSNMVKKGGFFGFDFMFNEIANELLPFDFETFENSNQEFVIGATNCKTGKEEFFRKSKISTEEMFTAAIASSSLPLVSRMVDINGNVYLDGGIADSVPIKKSISDGNRKNIVILTRNIEYRKKKSGLSLKAVKVIYRNYPKLIKALENRYRMYNDTLDYIERLEKEGSVFVIRPAHKVGVKRMEKDKVTLTAFYTEGYNSAKVRFDRLMNWINKK